MGNRKNGHRVYTQAEYEHFCFSGEPFTGYVEGIGYTCTEVVVTARQINRSGTEFVFDLSYVGYTFDINDMPGEAPQTLSQLEESRNRASGDPDRSKYWKIPTMDKFEYSDEGARQLLNPVAFIDNVAIELINSVVYLANSLINSGQVLYHEGAGSWWDYEWGGFKNQVKGIGDWFVGTYNYHTKTPARQQWTDFKKEISNIESWEKSTAFAGTLALGGYGMASKAGAVGRGTGMLTKVPAGAATPSLAYPSITTSDGFLLRGFNVRTPINIPVQRFGQMSLHNPDFWGIRLGSSKFVGRRIFSIKTEWNSLTQYSTGIIPKGTQIKLGIVGPQFPIYKYSGGGIQMLIESNQVVKQSSRIVNIKY